MGRLIDDDDDVPSRGFGYSCDLGDPEVTYGMVVNSAEVNVLTGIFDHLYVSSRDTSVRSSIHKCSPSVGSLVSRLVEVCLQCVFPLVVIACGGQHHLWLTRCPASIFLVSACMMWAQSMGNVYRPPW